MKRRSLSVALALSLVLAAPAPAAVFAARGAKATLTVEYVYSANGKTQDQNDSHRWSVTRSVKLRADLVAQEPQSLSSIHAMEPGQKADAEAKQAKARSAQEKMAPLQADIQKIMAKCGEDQACMEREIQKYGMANSDSATMNSARSARSDVQAASAQGPARYQLWKATSQAGTYSIEETRQDVVADPACGKSMHCVTDETAKGGGEIPAPPSAAGGTAAFSMAEVDSSGKTVTIVLPVPISPLPYSKTVKSDSPGTRSGTFPERMRFPPMDLKPVRVPLKAGGINESGTQEIPISGNRGDGGTLTIRWSLTAK